MGIQSILSFLRLRGTYPPCLFLISAANDAVGLIIVSRTTRLAPLLLRSQAE